MGTTDSEYVKTVEEEDTQFKNNKPSIMYNNNQVIENHDPEPQVDKQLVRLLEIIEEPPKKYTIQTDSKSIVKLNANCKYILYSSFHG